MTDYKSIWKNKITDALSALAAETGAQVDAALVAAENPPKPEMGDIGFPMFPFAKVLRKGPPQIAQAVIAKLGTDDSDGTAKQIGPYVNIFLNRVKFADDFLNSFPENSTELNTLAGKRIMVEFSSPNTNKPLHLGHLRNDALGESVSRILAACGAEVRKVCIINDRGIHICKSMLAYKNDGGTKTPESEHVKSDHFVGDYYVAFSNELKTETAEVMRKEGIDEKDKKLAEEKTSCMTAAREMLRKWEAGDAETVELWKKMNGWTISGMKETYERTGVSFDKY
jgi:arginyl-tRNA synthetase